MKEKRNLSKSRFMNGVQCLKLLWVACNDPERIPPPDASLQFVFDQGHRVGELAQRLYPDGIPLDVEDLDINLEETRAALSQRRPLFEAAFAADRLYCRVDILNPVDNDAWDIIEVKSTNEVKEEHRQDVAFQLHCCTLAGLKVRRCHIMHLNREYIKQGRIDPAQLFLLEDVTDDLDKYATGMEGQICDMLAAIDAKECPDVSIGRHCHSPYDCALQEQCWAYLPDHHVMTLYYGKKLGEDLISQDILHISDIPDELLNGRQMIQKKCVVSGRPHIDRGEIEIFLKSLKYPLYFLDFETFATAIPIYDGTRPHQNIPFQFSLHVLKRPDDDPEHYYYLGDGKCDPRPALLAELKKVIGRAGSILVYYESFEKNRLKELARDFPEYSNWIEDLIQRIVDLHIPFKNFSYYHPEQRGSASLKQVLPAITDMSYDNLEIMEGNMASIMFIKAAFSDIPEKERQKIFSSLLTYCSQDTLGMIEMLRRLEKVFSC